MKTQTITNLKELRRLAILKVKVIDDMIKETEDKIIGEAIEQDRWQDKRWDVEDQTMESTENAE